VSFPKPPERPDPRECCGRGCCPCILDYWEDAMDRWRERVRELGGDPQALLAEPAPPQDQR
jgi:hypothetical protein